MRATEARASSSPSSTRDEDTPPRSIHVSQQQFTDVAKSCISGELARAAQDALSGDPIGRLYAPNVIDEWTQDITDETQRARGERSAEIYWNVSTWNPYQVVLIKTQLTARETTSAEARRDTILVRTD